MNSKPWWLSKTLWLHFVGVAILTLNQIVPLTSDPKVIADIGIALNVLGFLNRFLTNASIGSQGNSQP